MAPAMIRLTAIIFFSMAIMAQGQRRRTSPPGTALCLDPNFDCYDNPPLDCPSQCPSSCAVDCLNCVSVCPTRRTPPPPPRRRPRESPPPPPSTTTTRYPPPISSPPTPTLSPPPISPPTPVSSPPPPPTPDVSTPPTSPPPPTPDVSTPPTSPPPSTPDVSTPPTSPPPPTPDVSTPTTSPPPSTPDVSTPPTSPPPPTPDVSTPPTSPPPSTPDVSTPPTSPPPPTPDVSTPPTSPPLSPPPTSTLSPPPPTPSPPPEVAGKVVYCPQNSKCKGEGYRCPPNCPAAHCWADCVHCKPICDCIGSGTICQDPRFVGADGLTFYFHGKKDRDFCIVSDSNVHINAHFIGRKNENLTRDFTWVQSLGILFDNHQIFISAKKTATWDDAVDRLGLAFDGEAIKLSEDEGAKWQPTTAPGVSITRFQDTNAAVIEVEGNFRIRATVVPITEKESRIHKYGITNEDCFAHLDLSFKFYSLTGAVNGVLGQTYASNYVSRVKMGVDMPVLGGNKEFVSTNLFSTDCAVARFSGTPLISEENFEYENLNCASGLGVGGVVCKR